MTKSTTVTTTTSETVTMKPNKTVRAALENIFGPMTDGVWSNVEAILRGDSKPPRKTISSVVEGDLADFRALCSDPSLSYSDIGELYGCTGAMVRTLAEKHGCLVPRKRGRKPGTSTSSPAVEETTETAPAAVTDEVVITEGETVVLD